MKKVNEAPLFAKLQQFAQAKPISFHVPGHKSGMVFPDIGRKYFEPILPIDLTELTGLDDLHASSGVIDEAQNLASKWFGSNNTYFLVGGSTVGNLAMILARCSAGDKVLVQRNSHKSIMNGLELSGAKPIFLTPEFEERVNRYIAPSVDTVKKAVKSNPDSKALILTYPDYYGRAYPIKEMIDIAHSYHIPVLVDEAHGVHFSLDGNFPPSALKLGADVVVQSAHKMAPAMTMASYLHIKSSIVQTNHIEFYLQTLQSSSPSYPLLASLDLARYYLEGLTKADIMKVENSARELRHYLNNCSLWDVLHPEMGIDDPLKITLQVKQNADVSTIVAFLESEGVYPELWSDKQILFVHGLAPLHDFDRINHIVEIINQQLKLKARSATIDSENQLFIEKIKKLPLSYEEMKRRQVKQMSWDVLENHIAAEAIIPYPPGIPMIVKGEVVTKNHIKMFHNLMEQGIHFQNPKIKDGIKVFLP
ncbi:aminotransferase class I/II-fold pyridoxal phosphate-dependent enzyme [Aquibacillus albus]|uniref:Lysine decarboxylase n=1 Tax=Aquibacillus albus TaxID=1168171 RepID=A0ABS2N4P8_9BACI|nr:aminotransferase class I/II-fold pyridoxal phosphate-dependent enzyme [Aquibacillus albus]MBM7573125.1 lysine decarboxylase [Aquibacillus albus]